MQKVYKNDAKEHTSGLVEEAAGADTSTNNVAASTAGDTSQKAGTSVDTATGQAADSDISTARVKNIFAKIARKYNRFNAFSSFGAYKLWLSGMMKQLSINEGAHILDVAGGTGDVSFALAKTKNPAHITCTDLVPEMLDVARGRYEEMRGDASKSGGATTNATKANTSGAANTTDAAKANTAGAANTTDAVPTHTLCPITFQVADGQNLPFESESFDCVSVAYGIRNMPKREQALSEAFRVLAPGGAFVCLEFSTPPNKLWRALYSFYLKYGLPFWGRVVCHDKESFIYLARSIRAFPNQQDFAHMLEDAGFTNVSWKNYTGGIAAVHVAQKPR